MFVSTLFSTLLLAALASAQYQMVKEYIGDDFFNDWNFYGNYDNLTNGNVNYVTAKQAFQQKLAYINSAGNAIMKVDNTTELKYPEKRNSIRISSKHRFTVGSLWIADMVHVPYGCSVWPAWWSQAANWPAGGEIDTLEGVNQVTMQQMGLHTLPGCTFSNTSVQTSSLINSTECSIYANSNQGCITTNPTTASYGAGLAANGGGVWVTEFAIKGISIWFFPRHSIPDVLQHNASTIDTTALGTPVANWPADGCNINKYFDPQQLVFTISLCGDYAGNPSTFYKTCNGFCYDDWVLGSPSNYDNAYFEVSYIRVFGEPGELTVQNFSSGALRSNIIDTLVAAATVTLASFLFW